MSESESSFISAVPHVKSGHILALHLSKTSTLHWHPGWGNIPTCIQWSILSFKHKIRIISKCLTFFPRVQQYVICLYHFVSVWCFIPYSSPDSLLYCQRPANHQGRHVEKNISETWVAPTHLEWWMLVPAIFQALVHPRRLTAGTYQNLQITRFFCKERDLNQTSMLMFQSLIFRGVLRRSLEDVKYLPKKKIPFIPYLTSPTPDITWYV